MPFVVEQKELAIRRAIRDAKSIDALITSRQIVDMLDKKFNHSFDYAYICKLIRKVDREVVMSIDGLKTNEEIAQISERVRFARESLIRIATGQADETGIRPAYRDKTAAWRTLLAWEKFLLDAKRQLGIFDEVKDNPMRNAEYREISDEERSRMAIAFRSLGISLPEPRLLEPVAPKMSDTEMISNERTKIAVSETIEPKPTFFDPLAAKKDATPKQKLVRPAFGISIEMI